MVSLGNGHLVNVNAKQGYNGFAVIPLLFELEQFSGRECSGE